jgi:hypothetical protein
MSIEAMYANDLAQHQRTTQPLSHFHHTGLSQVDNISVTCHTRSAHITRVRPTTNDTAFVVFSTQGFVPMTKPEQSGKVYPIDTAALFVGITAKPATAY